jgi:hypothetical protein
MSQSVKSWYVVLAAVLTVGTASLPSFGKQNKDSNAPSVKGTYAFRMGPVKSFAADSPGDQGGVSGAPRQDILRVGLFTADGNGGLSGHTIATTDTNQGKTWLVTFDWMGKYVVNADGTGYFSVDTVANMVCTDMTVNHNALTPHPVTTGGTPLAANVACPADIEGHEDYAFVFSTPGGKKFEFIETDNAGGGAKIFMTGSATRQQDQSSNNQGNDN